ncbi:hypothetical protein CEXT_488241 [Caerostris extrusa]|uniref:Uncharacterized protein n=1 Tax=Caerostris extrusa TaxID=172846 RepID=A0AAV4XCG2_CAEEX|nr:hypothetical protein CEXT_488241 [Caerostris extrusa]
MKPHNFTKTRTPLDQKPKESNNSSAIYQYQDHNLSSDLVLGSYFTLNFPNNSFRSLPNDSFKVETNVLEVMCMQNTTKTVHYERSMKKLFSCDVAFVPLKIGLDHGEFLAQVYRTEIYRRVLVIMISMWFKNGCNSACLTVFIINAP